MLMGAADFTVSSPSGLRSSAIHVSISAVLLFARRAILQAFHDASKTDPEGHPTEDAKESLGWIQERLDWTKYDCTPPPPEIREEFCGSFEWCCIWLQEDPDIVRFSGLPKEYVHIHRHDGHMERTGGVPQVLHTWERARRKYLQSKRPDRIVAEDLMTERVDISAPVAVVLDSEQTPVVV